ncbi:MAG: nucleotidyl transferase AbiEii/AbiGii toxin family protein [Minicystis sp.]
MGKPTELAEEQRRALDRLKAVRGIERFYLAGRTALALHLHHRRSLDLDLFSLSPDVDLSAMIEPLRRELPDLKVLSLTEAALRVVGAGIPIDFVLYPYALLDPPETGSAALPIAGLRDLAAMKLSAISQRGLRRDFWDVHAMVESGLTLREMADAYLARFGVAKADLYHVLRSLTYFDDAERAPEYPSGLTPKKWERIKEFFRAEAPKLVD